MDELSEFLQRLNIDACFYKMLKSADDQDKLQRQREILLQERHELLLEQREIIKQLKNQLDGLVNTLCPSPPLVRKFCKYLCDICL